MKKLLTTTALVTLIAVGGCAGGNLGTYWRSQGKEDILVGGYSSVSASLGLMSGSINIICDPQSRQVDVSYFPLRGPQAFLDGPTTIQFRIDGGSVETHYGRASDLGRIFSVNNDIQLAYKIANANSIVVSVIDGFYQTQLTNIKNQEQPHNVLSWCN